MHASTEAVSSCADDVRKAVVKNPYFTSSFSPMPAFYYHYSRAHQPLLCYFGGGGEGEGTSADFGQVLIARWNAIVA